MKKRVILAATLAALLTISSGVSTVAFAAETEIMNESAVAYAEPRTSAKIVASGSCGETNADNVSWKLDSNGTLTISGTGKMREFYAHSEKSPWYQYRNTIKAVIIKKGVTSIGDDAFDRCVYLESVSIPSGVTSIGLRAFYHTSRLKSISIPSSVTNIESEAFRYSGIQSITIPPSVKKMGNYCFANNSNLKSVTVAKGVTDIGTETFIACENLKSVVLSEGITEIKSYVFLGCKNLTSISIPDSVEEIEMGAFFSCENLASVTFPTSLKWIGSEAFRGCSNLSKIYFRGDSLPRVSNNSFIYRTLTAYYPDTWEKIPTSSVWGGASKITWVKIKSVARANVSGIKNKIYTDSAITQDITVNLDGTVLREGTDYTVSYANNVKPGTATVTITGKGNYTGTISKTFTIKEDGHVYSNNVDGTCNGCGVHREDVEVRQVTHMFRMYNPNTGEHFYTGSEVEKDNLVAAGWNYEGVGFTFPANTGAPVHRLFQPSTGEHLYTMDEKEKSSLMKKGWNYEGIAFNSAYDTEAVQYRLHNPNAKVGAYHFTFSKEERQNLLKAGWEDQGIGWYSCWK